MTLSSVFYGMNKQLYNMKSLEEEKTRKSVWQMEIKLKRF